MRRCLTLLAILAAGTTRAADAPKPNTLTPQEIAEGWISLFDGETMFGWTAEGTVKVGDGTLKLGDDKESSVQTPRVFSNFVLRFEYHLEGARQLRLRVFDGWRVIGANPGRAPWTEYEFRFETSEKGTMISHARTDPNGVRVGVRSAQPLKGTVTSVGFLSVKGGDLSIRNVKVKPLGLEPIFNGKDLTGWKQFTANEKLAISKFTVTPEGWLNVKNGPGDLQTEKEWKDFVFQGECISNGKALNSGVFFRCLPGQYQQGYEFQIHNGFKDNDRTKPADYGTGAIYRRAPARKVVPNDHEWFTMTLIAHGNHFSTWVNGYQTVDWTDTRPENDNARNGCKLGAGPISLQGHDKTTDLSFRNLRIVELKKN
jgi:hypothetical protein